ncbi:DUF397 domain-containing protein [Streptomyces scabiei]|uniref:DUF397 domain-containing protein n=1 Tax=Streptomyces scabiei TaxID=1930 RepID=UPI0038F6B30D
MTGAREEAVLTEKIAPISWQKSSYSGSNTECCEVAILLDEVWIRDSKCPERAGLCFSSLTWKVALAYFGSGESAGGNNGQL